MDKIFEAYKEVINEATSKEIQAVKQVIKALEQYKKTANDKTRKKVEDAVEFSGEPSENFNFSDNIENLMQTLGDRFFGPPPVYDSDWDKSLDKVLSSLKKYNK